MCDEEMSSVSLFDWSRCNNAVVFQLLLIRPYHFTIPLVTHLHLKKGHITRAQLQSGHFLQG